MFRFNLDLVIATRKAYEVTNYNLSVHALQRNVLHMVKICQAIPPLF